MVGPLNVDRISWVQIAGTWYRVARNSFWVEGLDLEVPRGEGKQSLRVSVGRWCGFAYDKGELLTAPLDSIQAIRYAPEAP